ncbi:MAG: glycosyltransferase family 9 protein [Pseudobdellovibrionaceae bacterium]|jgi:ADP-heptose:LPS heptosyltransferase
MVQTRRKVLILRFSAFGDIAQALSIAAKLRQKDAECEIHFATKTEFAEIVQCCPLIARVWTLNKRTTFREFFSFVHRLRQEHFSHIYDAHNNSRSILVSFFLRPPWHLSRVWMPPLFLRKSQKRWKRFLLFQLRKNTYELPFSGQRDLLEPLKSWGLDTRLPAVPVMKVPEQAFLALEKVLGREMDFVTLAPSAAHPLKRWPLEKWIQLIQMLPQTRFVVLGGKEDQFLVPLQEQFPDRVRVLAGQLTYLESAAAVVRSRALVTNDTGLMHIAEQTGKPCIALMGPAPFGFPSRPTTLVLERNLSCRPCSKHGQGPCRNPIYQECLRSIEALEVKQALQKVHYG